MEFLLKGIILGFSIAAPVGPIGILCIRRSLAKGHLSGFVTGLGAASADVIYGIIASFGLTFISSFLVQQQYYLQIVGMVFLFYIGIKTFREKPREDNQSETKSSGLLSDYISTLILTITNPMTILLFAAVFAGMGLGNKAGNYISATILVTGVFLGSAAWWLILSYGAGFFKKKLTPEFLTLINKIAGTVITGFAVVLLGTLIRKSLTH